ncbi:hypothetical protein FKP32DRAFT_124386 [Trametes sanguinea]|nr:hypothetical protein FKP32DRAFT_124386 [Trametes sanguinea]
MSPTLPQAYMAMQVLGLSNSIFRAPSGPCGGRTLGGLQRRMCMVRSGVCDRTSMITSEGQDPLTLRSAQVQRLLYSHGVECSHFDRTSGEFCRRPRFQHRPAHCVGVLKWGLVGRNALGSMCCAERRVWCVRSHHLLTLLGTYSTGSKAGLCNDRADIRTSNTAECQAKPDIQ